MSGDPDVAGYTRDGVRWELTFFPDKDKFILKAEHLLDVMKMLNASVEVLHDGAASAQTKTDLRNSTSN